MQRKSLEIGSIIDINKTKIKILSYIGEGSTCLAYTGTMMKRNSSDFDTFVTIKEFYPDSSKNAFDIERKSSGELKISKITKSFTEFQQKLEQFNKGFEAQNQLSNSDAMEITIKPLLRGTFGDSEYIVSDIHKGESLDKVRFESLDEKLSCLVRVVEMLGILHDAGYMMLDFKPENILYIKHPQMVKLIDTDSIIPIEGRSNAVVYDSINKEFDNLYATSKYLSPDMLYFKNEIAGDASLYKEARRTYLQPTENVYSMGLYMFECLFDRMPSSTDMNDFENMVNELLIKYKSQRLSEAMAGKLIAVQKKALAKSKFRYRDANIMLRELVEAVENITLRKYIPKKSIAKANLTYLTYNMLEKYPLYTYAFDKDNLSYNFAILGKHGLRENILRAYISSCQMLDVDIHISMFSDDARDFFESYKKKNPEIINTIVWTIDGININLEDDIKSSDIVSKPLAYVDLFSNDSIDFVKSVVSERKLSYVIILNELVENDIKAISLSMPQRKSFVGFLREEMEYNDSLAGRGTQYYVIHTDRISQNYNEDVYKSRVFRMGLAIHEYYYRESNPRATQEEIRHTYSSDWYNVESSERSAIHAKYKVIAAGIKDPDGENVPYAFYEKVLEENEDSKDIFDKLVALEHLSWSAYLILSGVRSVRSSDDIKKYMFEGQSDWKEKDKNGKLISHPCLVSSMPHRNIEASDWGRNYTKKTALQKFDSLDRRSLEMYKVAKTKLEGDNCEGDERQLINLKFDQLYKAVIVKCDSYLKESFEYLRDATEKCLQGISNASVVWELQLKEFKKDCLEYGIEHEVFDSLSEIAKMMKLVLFVVKKQDFKIFDEVIIKALPKILLLGGKDESADKITIVRPLVEDDWKNLLSTIIVNPDRLVLVTDFNNNSEMIEQKYTLFLKSCNINSKICIRNSRGLRKYGGDNGLIFIDQTGAEFDSVNRILTNSCMKNAHVFTVKGEKLVPVDNNKLITVFNRSLKLTVRETLELHGATIISEKMRDYVSELAVSEYKTIWNLYRDLSDGRKWHYFISALEDINLSNMRKINIDSKDVAKRIETDSYIEYDTAEKTGILSLLRRMKEADLILGYTIQGDYGKISFSTEYKDVMNYINMIVLEAVNSPDRHKYSLQMEGNKAYIIDDTLYVDEIIPHKAVYSSGKDYTVFLDKLFEEVVDKLNRLNKDRIFKNVRIENCEDGCHLSFRYSSRAVKEILRKEGSILEALIYWECKQNQLFDDIRVNVEFEWAGNRTKNEIDIIGTKNSKTYFISAKMKAPEKEHIYEIESLCNRFSIYGKPILVTSYFATGENELTGQDYKGRPVAIENRVEDMGDVGYIGKDGVDRLVEGSNGTKRRAVIVADSIKKIMEQ